MSPTGKRLIVAAVASAGFAGTVCLVVLARSMRAISNDQTPANLVATAPATQPFVQAFKRPPTTGPSIRVAVIGGMVFTGFWNALTELYEKQTGVRIELVVTGPKNDLIKIFKQGNVDVITMHSSDTMINLTANGYTLDAKPWMRNDLVIVGPPEDPAKIRGMTDAAAALKKIAAAKSPFVVHSSLGSQEVLLNILEPNEIQLDPANTTVLFDDEQRDVLKIAGEKHAYTLVGRIPFHTGRLPNNGLVMMVEGDPRLMRPYLVAATNPKWMPGVNVEQAKRFTNWLRSKDTQTWIAGFGKGTLDDRPIFFPITLPEDVTGAATEPGR